MSKTVIQLDYDPSDGRDLYQALMALLAGHEASEAMPALMAAMSHTLVVMADGDRDMLVRDTATAFKTVMEGSINLREIAENIRASGNDPGKVLKDALDRSTKGTKQ